MPFDEVKVRPLLVTTALFLILLLLINVGVLLFLVIRDIHAELIQRAVQEAELEAYTIVGSVEEIVLTSERRDLDEVRSRSEELMWAVNSILDRKHIYLYCTVVDPSGHVVFHRASEGFDVERVEEFLERIPQSRKPVDREIVAYIDHKPVRILTVWVPILIHNERVGTVVLGVSRHSVSEQMRRITSSVMRKYLAGGVIIAVIVGAAFLMVVQLIRKVRQAGARIEYADRLIYVGTLASGLGHEIRNSLNAIRINVQMLEELTESVGPEKTETKRDLLQSTDAAVGELERLVSEFLRFARPSALKRESLNVCALVREVLGFVEGECIQRGVEIVDHLESDLSPVQGDPQQLKQVFLNLLLNASQAMPEGGSITVSSNRLSKGRIAVRIADTGVGVPEDQQSQIFDPFYSTKKGGTGLGLPIARRIVEEHGGEIALQSELGTGTTFTVELPAEDDRSG